MGFDFEKLSVLAVDDNEPMRKLICSLLEALGVVQIGQAENGKQGFERFLEMSPDIVLADWAMSPVDGIGLTREIRTSKLSPNRMVPVILVTGHSDLHHLSEARDNGVTEFLSKPFSAANIAKRIAYVITQPRDFIDHKTFFGPCRRRHVNPEYDGPFRREEGVKSGRLKRDVWEVG